MNSMGNHWAQGLLGMVATMSQQTMQKDVLDVLRTVIKRNNYE